MPGRLLLCTVKHSILISRFCHVENLLHFNLAYFQVKCWYFMPINLWWWAISKICMYLILRFCSKREKLMLVKYTCFTVLSADCLCAKWWHVIGLCEQVLAEMDPDDILAKQVEQLEKEKRELQEKLKAQEKKVCKDVASFGLWRTTNRYN